jgi:hypothetical protein
MILRNFTTIAGRLALEECLNTVLGGLAGVVLACIIGKVAVQAADDVGT